MTNEQFEAMVSLMETIASAAAGRATHQHRSASAREYAEEEARRLLVTEDD